MDAGSGGQIEPPPSRAILDYEVSTRPDRLFGRLVFVDGFEPVLVGLATSFLITGSFSTGLDYRAVPHPDSRHRRRRVVHLWPGRGVATPMIMGWIATTSSIAAGLPLVALSFLMLGPLFVRFAPDMTRRELTDFVREKVA